VGSVRFLSTHYSANLGCAFGVDFRPGFGVWAGQVEGEARPLRPRPHPIAIVALLKPDDPRQVRRQ
jgi:hypothetical protein